MAAIITDAVLRELVRNRIAQARISLIESARIPAGEYPAIEVSQPPSGSAFDLASNVALVSAKPAGTNPRELAAMLAEVLAGQFESAGVAGPGFINLRFGDAELSESVRATQAGAALSEAANPQKINVEYVSVNPNGPITVGSGRGAAYGDTLCNVLEAVGHTVHREYYVNDGINSEQMRLFAESIRAIREGRPVPENGYKGDYVQALAHEIEPSDDLVELQRRAQELMIERQRSDLALFRVKFDTWFSEQALHESGAVERELAELVERGVADEEPYQTVVETSDGESVERREPQEPGALWLRSARLGDQKDRVLRRRDGRLTYIAADVAYHHDKFGRPQNADRLITVLGPDHHGYIGRLKAVVRALGHDPDDLEVLIFQIVRFVRDGKPAPMRKRDGNIYALSDLIEEVGAQTNPEGSPAEQARTGADVVRYFYLMRSHDTHMDFDLDLARKQGDENPVFYSQYAHARICSILEKAGSIEDWSEPDEIHPMERALIFACDELDSVVARCAEDYGVHRLTTYAQGLARAYHHFYDSCRVLDEAAPARTTWRLSLCRMTRSTLQRAFDLLGISAPESM